MTRSLKAITVRVGLILICVYSTSTYISAQDAGNTAATDGEAGPNLDRNEVRSDPVRFINRTNRRASEQMRNQDNATGVGIAKKILDSNEAETGGVTVTRVFDGNKEGLGADIMTISDKANFGHINRVKRILIGYLMEAFEYNEADAEVISRFILYYNARHRGDLDKVKEKYSEAVVSALDPARVGIDRSYQNWAGKTQLLL
ncbi:MAG: hypothetical protein KDK30_09505, partial [Leptospiraceae bacterium]|nr:hypothetical protein [Leptospiraceae bacterium]